MEIIKIQSFANEVPKQWSRKGINFLALLLLVHSVLIKCVDARGLSTSKTHRLVANDDDTGLTPDERRKLDERNDYLTKNSVKTFEANGATYECLDLFKQPAAGEPSAKEILKKFLEDSRPKPSPAAASENDDGCPAGTVPIQRILEKDVLETRKVFSVKRPRTNDAGGPKVEIVIQEDLLLYEGINHGVKGGITVWPLDVKSGQSSQSKIKITSGDESIEAGWIVNPDLFGDATPRTYIAYVDSFGGSCINTQCETFTQASDGIRLGMPITELSIYSGTQQSVEFIIYLDDDHTGSGMKAWWLVIGFTRVGFWSTDTLTDLAQYATTASFGGTVNYRNDTGSPPMGNGRSASEGFRGASAIWSIDILDADLNVQHITDVTAVVSNRTCYDYGFMKDEGGAFPASYMFYGGAANC